MKKYIYNIALACLGLATATGCEKELMDYEGEDSIYFDVRRGATWLDPDTWSHYDFSEVPFGSTMDDEMELSLKIMASGKMRDYDRPFTITANPDSTTAVSGREYDSFQESGVIKAGENSTTITLTLRRSEQIDQDTLMLQLQLHENEYFKLEYTDFNDAPGHYSPSGNMMFGYNKNACVHNIFIYDVLTRPEVWSGNDVTGMGLFGKFSAKKFRLMMEITGTTIEDYQSTATMPSIRQQAISETMSLYLLEKAAEGDPVLDEDGTMMFFMYVSTLGGSAAWAPFTKPEDYYK